MTPARKNDLFLGNNRRKCDGSLVCFFLRERVWCMGNHVCNVLYNVNIFLCKDDHDAFCEGP